MTNFLAHYINRHEAWLLASQTSRIASGLALVSVLATQLPPELVAQWYVFTAIFGVISLAEMGLSQVIVRHVAYAAVPSSNPTDFANLVTEARKVYVPTVLAICFIAITGGGWWLSSGYGREAESLSVIVVLSLWSAYVAGGLAQLMSLFYSAISTGLSEVGTVQRNDTIGTIANASLLVVFAVGTRSLLAPVLAFLVSRILVLALQRSSAAHLLSQRVEFATTREPSRPRVKLPYFDTAHMAVIMVAYQLLTSGTILLTSLFLPSEVIASYGLTAQITLFTLGLTGFWMGASFPKMAACRVSHDTHQLRQLFWNAFRKTAIFTTLGLIALVGVGNVAASWAAIKTPLLPLSLLGIVAGTAWLEFLIGQFAQLLLSQGDFRFAYFSLLGATCITTIAFVQLSGGQQLSAVLWTRLGLYTFLVGVPIILTSRPYLRSQTRAIINASS